MYMHSPFLCLVTKTLSRGGGIHTCALEKHVCCYTATEPTALRPGIKLWAMVSSTVIVTFDLVKSTDCVFCDSSKMEGKS